MSNLYSPIVKMAMKEKYGDTHQSVAISKLGFFEKVIFELRSKLWFRILTWNYEISHFKNDILWLSVLITRMYKTVWLEMMVLELGEVTPYCTSWYNHLIYYYKEVFSRKFSLAKSGLWWPVLKINLNELMNIYITKAHF